MNMGDSQQKLNHLNSNGVTSNNINLKQSEFWSKLQPILEKYILKNNISSFDKGLDLVLTWFEIISKNSEKINTFKSIVGLCPPDMAELRQSSRLSFSTSSIGDLLDNRNDDNKKRLKMSDVPEDTLFDFRNKRMKVSRLLCHEEMASNSMEKNIESITTISNNNINNLNNTIPHIKHPHSDEENSEGFEEDENSCLDSFDSNSPEDAAYGSDNESNLQIDEDSLIKIRKQQHSNHSTIDLTHIKIQQQQQQQMQPQIIGKIQPNAAANGTGIAPSPKQLMTIREKMLEYIQKNPNPNRPSCIQVFQQPSSKVVWKNRRLDTPFKLKVDMKTASNMASQNLTCSNIITIGIVTDHKGKLQIDSVENFTEPLNAQGLSVFQGLKMTKGTWGKEWNLTFIAVVRPNNQSYNNPIILSVSQPFPIVVKTRKNPQIRHNSYSNHILNSASENSSSSPEASPTIAPRRGRIPNSAPVMSLGPQANLRSSTGSINTNFNESSNTTTTTTRTYQADEMASLLWAAEIKQKEVPDGTEPETIQNNNNNNQNNQNNQNNNNSQNSNNNNNNSQNISPKNSYHGVILNTPKPVTTR
ncbi:hypothetical protein CYY_002593 [Polysphondylium violaceum]|uniref:Uncharacterized protein n=1 Tax=Polysphondylium violaceum TaxID=133409 RepID=A0A8J4V9G4_9MYCE|nr:hypothetical protein CYY_002593 [Polysphondylium violaceum]